MNKKMITILMFITMLVLTGISSGVTWSVNNAQDVNVGHNPLYLDSDEDETFFTLVNYNGENLELIEAYTGNSNNLIIHDEGNLRGGIIASNGYLYYATEDGIYKRTLESTQTIWANGQIVEAPQDDGNGNVTIAGSTYNAPDEDMATVLESYESNTKKVTTQTAKNGVLREEDGYIYYTTDGHDFYRIKLTNDLSSYYTRVSHNIEVFDIYDGTIAGIKTSGNTMNIDIDVYYNDNLIKNYNRHNDYSDQRFNQIKSSGSINIIAPDKIYVGAMMWGYDDYDDHSGESKTLNINNILNSSGGFVDGWGYDDSYSNSGLQKPDWVVSYKEPIFAQLTNDGDNFIIAETQDAKANPETVPAQLDYEDETRLSTEQDQYYNNTAVDIFWRIKAKGSGYTEQELEDNFRYQIDFINPRGLKFNEYRISLSDFDITEVPLSENIQFDETGTVILNPPGNDWKNGTYTARLYEVNRTTQDKALVADTQYEVINESSEQAGSTIGEDTEDKTGADFFTDIIDSQFFWALMIILMASAGLGSIGGIAGLFTGFGAGVTLTYLAGLLPLWVMLVFAMILAIAMAIIMRDTVTSRY